MAIETGAIYHIYTPDQSSYFALNDPTDVNMVGYVSDITGLDDAPVRENAQVANAGDGGYNGPFWRDRRPWTVAGFVVPQVPTLARSLSQDKMSYVLNQALRSDGIMTWTPADGEQRMLYFRKQQPTRVSRGSGNVDKQFQFACVTADWRILSTPPHAVSGHWVSGTAITFAGVTNNGNAPAAPLFTVTGPVNNLIIINYTQGVQLSFPYSGIITAGHTATINLQSGYPTLTLDTGVTIDQYLDPINSNWDIAVLPGVNTIGLTATSMTSASAMSISWMDSWY